MSNIIKSFRVLEKNVVQNNVSDLQDDDSIDIQVKEIMLEEARIEAENIIRAAEEKSKEILRKSEKQKENALIEMEKKSSELMETSKIEGYNQGYDNGFEKGLKEGYDNGYNEGKIVSDGLIEESIEIKESYIEKRNNLLEVLERDIIELVIEIYQKILDKEIKEEDSMITSLVLKGIKNLDPTEKLTIIVSKEDFDTLNMAKNEILAKASLINELEIKYDINLSKGDCILETPKGNIDISIKDQIEEVRELLTTILNNE